MSGNLLIESISQRLAGLQAFTHRRSTALGALEFTPLPEACTLSSLPDDLPAPVPVEAGEYWGAWRTNFILSGRFCRPTGWPANEPAALYLPIGVANDFSHPEALVYIDGVPLAGCDRHHQEIALPPAVLDGRQHELLLLGWTGMQHWWGSQPGSRLFMHACRLVQIDQPLRDLLATARVALETARCLPEGHPVCTRLLAALDSASELNTPGQSAPPPAAILSAHASLQAAIHACGSAPESQVWAIGQSHIDLAWLWTLDQTRQKAARTFHTVLQLMDRFPNFTYTQSQPQLYEYIQQDQPALFSRIQQRVAEGRWEVLGGMWVEPDCNMSGAEALARQFLLGRSYFTAVFGPQAESPVLWLPDSFGFPWSLPQLMLQAGIPYFLTIKMGWNDTNRLPSDSFWWQGMDGSRVLVHLATNECNVFLSPKSVLDAREKCAPKDLAGFAMLYGWGDGGGGPTVEMLENLRELQAFPTLPAVRPAFARDFFTDQQHTAGAALPVWNDELYLEKHRGVYTTHGRIKRANRQCEFMLHDLEWMSSTAALLDPGYTPSLAEIERMWKTVCLNQFHDILPGSSIGEVYCEAQRQYDEVLAAGRRSMADAAHAVSARLGGDLIIANPTGFSRTDPALIEGALPDNLQLLDPAGDAVAIQPVEGGTLLACDEIPPNSFVPLRRVQAAQAPSNPCRCTAGDGWLENDLVRVEFNPLGEITRVFDRHSGREVIPPGCVANQLQVFADLPADSDAWELDPFYETHPLPLEPVAQLRVLENGPLRAMLEVRRNLLNSQFVQCISITHRSRRIDFDTHIEWRERHVLLKAAFPVEILARNAACEIQWGVIDRPTHRNTSWDQARHEVCAQKWVDLSEDGYGVSLLNNGKYGHDIRGNVMRISLLRAPTSPDPDADQGEHHFIYSLLPHGGDWRGDTAAQAYALNDPLIVLQPASQARPRPFSLIAHDAPNVIIETVKPAEDGNGLIVRLYESHRRRGAVTLSTGFKLQQAWQTDLLENNVQALSCEDRRVTVWLSPCQILTLRLVPQEYSHQPYYQMEGNL